MRPSTSRSSSAATSPSTTSPCIADAGTITGLIGPNGAGKTTLFNVITGLLPPSSGRVLIDEQDVTRMAPHKRARLGLARTFQRLELFTSLTVRDNVRVAGEIRNRWGLSGHRQEAHRRRARRPTGSSRWSGLSEVADREVGEIPTGQARVVELARALMIRPTLLLLDEPASGQTEEETEAFGALLRKLATEDGLGICLVEHDMALVMNVCEIIHVLEFGRIIASGTGRRGPQRPGRDRRLPRLPGECLVSDARTDHRRPTRPRPAADGAPTGQPLLELGASAPPTARSRCSTAIDLVGARRGRWWRCSARTAPASPPS